MKKHLGTTLLLIVVAGLLLLYSAAFTVDFRQTAIVKTFGKAGPPIDGETASGLHWKLPWPIQSLVRYDRRNFVFDDAHEQISTKDKQNIVVTAFCAWRIEDPEKFLRRIEDVNRAEDQLRKLVRAKKSNIIGEHNMSDFVNTDPAKMRLAEIEKEIAAAVQTDAGRDYGIRIVSLGIRSVELPKDVTARVVDSMREERNRYAQDYKTRGEAEASRITARAEAARDQILAFTNAKAETIRSEGKRETARLYAQFRQNEQFAMFLRELDFWREALKDNAVIVLDPTMEHSIGFLKNGPSLPPLTHGAATGHAQTPAAPAATK